MANPQKILIAQNDPKSASSLSVALQQQGWAIMMARDVLQAFTFTMKERPVAALLSGQLPGGGGLFLLKRMRQSVHTATIPVIVITDREGPPRQEFLSAGAVECMEQPIEIESLCAAVRRHVAEPSVVREAPVEAIRAPERLAALRETGLLDSPPTEAFDGLTRLATKLLGTPVALVSLVGMDRQFFKSQVGLPEPWAKSRQTRLSHSFCQWVVSGKDELVIADARQHAGLLPNLALRDLGVIAYAGIPLSASGGQVIGSFCAIDTKPHTWTEDDLAILRDLSKVAEAYTALEEKRHAETAAGPGDRDTSQRSAVSMHVIGTAVSCATRLLQRGGERMSETERALILHIVERLSQELSQSASVHP